MLNPDPTAFEKGKKDPAYKAEKKRKEKEPESFGSTVIAEKPKDWKPSQQVWAERRKAEAEEVEEVEEVEDKL